MTRVKILYIDPIGNAQTTINTAIKELEKKNYEIKDITTEFISSDKNKKTNYRMLMVFIVYTEQINITADSDIQYFNYCDRPTYTITVPSQQCVIQPQHVDDYVKITCQGGKK